MATSNPKTQQHLDSLCLSPVVIVALGAHARSEERLIGLQAGVGRLIGAICNLRLPSLRLPRIAQASRILRSFH